ncbi:BglG family transcription antiterminator, partial [Tetragenococcus halophilus]
MNKKLDELIDFFSKREGVWLTSEEVAIIFNVTPRTIRNRIAKINEEFPYLIKSSNLGYIMHDEQYKSFLKNINITIGDEQSRESLILLELLKHSKNGINIFDLSEKLYVSESTLKNDLQRMKNTLPSDKLYISIKNNMIKLEGKEKFKRQYMITLLYGESDLYKELSGTIQKMIGYIPLVELRKTIKKVLNNYNIVVNEYALDNIVLHFAVSIERINQGYVLSEEKPEIELAVNLKREYKMVNDIIYNLLKLETYFSIRIPWYTKDLMHK